MAAIYSSDGAYAYDSQRFESIVEGPKTFAGRDIFKMFFPLMIFFATCLKIYLNIPPCIFTFYKFIATIYPYAFTSN